MEGIKETKEALKGLMLLTVLLAERFKDGVQTEDAALIFAKLQGDDEFKKALVEAYNGADKVPAELKDLSVGEGVELAVQVLQDVPKIIAALKK